MASRAVTPPVWPGLAPIRAPLDAGRVVIAKTTRKIPAVALNVAVPAGSVCDPPGAAGAMNLGEIERSLVVNALAQARYNKTRAAKLLGLTRAQLYSRIEKYGLEEREH